MRKTKEEAEQTRQKILNAARKMFFQNGVAKTSLEHIAKEAGVTRGAIYWHFKDKTALFFALQQSACEPIDEGIQKIFKNPQYQNPLDAIEAALQFFFFHHSNAPKHQGNVFHYGVEMRIRDGF